MHIVNYDIAKNLSNYIKNHPLKFNECTSKLVNEFIIRLDLNIPNKEMIRLRIIYQFIFMYSLITHDLNSVRKMMNNSKITLAIIEALIIKRNLKLRQNQKLVDLMVTFGQNHSKTLASSNAVVLGCLYFDISIFYAAIKFVTNLYCI